MSSPKGASREVLFEFRPSGQQVRVAAIDVSTGIEVIVIAPVTASEHHMKSIALAKLQRRIERDSGSL